MFCQDGCIHFEAALTMAMMPARIASGSRSQASMTVARSGSVLRLSVGRGWETALISCRKSQLGEGLRFSG